MSEPQQPSKASSDDKQLAASALLRSAMPVAAKLEARNGVPLLTLGGDAAPVTAKLVNELRDELP
jgi:hypothetical protein